MVEKTASVKKQHFLPPHHPTLQGHRVLGPPHHTHLCLHWQTSPASVPHTAGPLLPQACEPASRGRRSGRSPAWTCEAQRCSCNALPLDATKSTCSVTGRKGDSTGLRGGSIKPHVALTGLTLGKPKLTWCPGEPEENEEWWLSSSRSVRGCMPLVRDAGLCGDLCGDPVHVDTCSCPH